MRASVQYPAMRPSRRAFGAPQGAYRQPSALLRERIDSLRRSSGSGMRRSGGDLLRDDDLVRIEVATRVGGGEQSAHDRHALCREVILEPRRVLEADAVVVRDRAPVVDEGLL